ncbi:helix-turn-helix domain-containing protein [Streptomyces sp. NBC_01614]|uniref:helix-turn-helix domain-containing protein n=1 Tax=Streptomyces sp. NBC_01614 TaxID=2975897 RepID=UPI00386E6F70
MAPDLERLAARVKQRRTELRLGIEPAAKLAGISKDTWKRVEAGLTHRDTSYTGIETALQWAVGSCRRILDGEEPIINQPIEPGSDTHIAEIPKSTLERAVGDAVTSAAIATKGSLTGDEIVELNARVLKELRERGVI